MFKKSVDTTREWSLLSFTENEWYYAESLQDTKIAFSEANVHSFMHVFSTNFKGVRDCAPSRDTIPWFRPWNGKQCAVLHDRTDWSDQNVNSNHLRAWRFHPNNSFPKGGKSSYIFAKLHQWEILINLITKLRTNGHANVCQSVMGCILSWTWPMSKLFR